MQQGLSELEGQSHFLGRSALGAMPPPRVHLAVFVSPAGCPDHCSHGTIQGCSQQPEARGVAGGPLLSGHTYAGHTPPSYLTLGRMVTGLSWKGETVSGVSPPAI